MKKFLLINLLLAQFMVTDSIMANEMIEDGIVPGDVPIVIMEQTNSDTEMELKPDDVEKAQSEAKESKVEVIPDDSAKEDNDAEISEIQKGDSNIKDEMEEIHNLDQRVVLINDTDRIVEINSGRVKLETPLGFVEKDIKEIGGKKLANGKHEIKDKNGKKIILPAMNEKSTNVLALLGSLLFFPILLKIKQFNH